MLLRKMYRERCRASGAQGPTPTFHSSDPSCIQNCQGVLALNQKLPEWPISVVQGKLQAASAHGQTACARHVGWHMLVTGLFSQAIQFGGIFLGPSDILQNHHSFVQHFLGNPSHRKDVVVLLFKSAFHYVIFVDDI